MVSVAVYILLLLLSIISLAFKSVGHFSILSNKERFINYKCAIYQENLS